LRNHNNNENPEKSDNNDPQPSFSANELKSLAKDLREGLNINGTEKEKLLQEIQLLRILASLGLTIGEFVHEVKHHLRAFDLDIDFLHRKLSEEAYSKRTIRLKSNLNSFTTYTSYFDKTISENINRELAPVELKDAVHSFYKIVNSDALRSGINMESPEFIGYDLYTCPMHMSEWASILFNFYTNSKKAIKRAEVSGLIKVKAGSTDDKVYLEFSDNGDGIPQDKHERIFDVFFTTSFPSGKKATEIEEITGTGLGLKIVKDIVEGYGGEIFVTSPAKGYSATIRIEIPKTEIR
jgi:signal transduction histidine kinase